MKKILIGLFAILLLLGGCFNKTAEEKAQEGTTPVQDYVGQGFSFVDGDKSAERVKNMRKKLNKKRSII